MNESGFEKQTDLFWAFYNSFVDSNYRTVSNLTPSFIYNSNDVNDHSTVVASLRNNLRGCDEFIFSVAFITQNGLILLKEVLEELAQKGIRGKILTTNYLDFTQPKALEDLMKMPNVDVRMHYLEKGNRIGFHTKGYIFRYGENYKAIIGSSNLTDSALSISQEWNTEIVSTSEGAMIKDILGQFEKLWDRALPLDRVLDRYRDEYENGRNKKPRFTISEPEEKVYVAPEPNSMQRCFVESLDSSISRGDKRGLLISSTGTGKTFASAFGVRDITSLKVKRLLYITHRETILKQAIASYRAVFGNEAKLELYTGNNHDITGQGFVFSTLNTIREERYRARFPRDHFDMIIIDEAHRISETGTYMSRIFDYFTPKYWLGMTATPDRTDHFDVYKVFDNNILYEIRLRGALEAQMLCPFHYFGLTDLSADGKQINESSSFNDLTADERVDRILKESEYYGYSGSRLKCLVFLSGIEEGKTLAEKINQRGYKAQFVSGLDPERDRAQAIRMLEEDDPTKPRLDFLLSVDVLSEGVDMPSVNQVILLRPTQSQIVFIQQMGRGLRLHEEKEYVVILDFIRNYDKNFLIPMAFTPKGPGGKGDITKTTIQPGIPGPNSIEFDPIAQSKVLDSIEKASIFRVPDLFSQYKDVKNRLGRTPTLKEFDENGELSGRAFLDFTTKDSYYDFIVKKDSKAVENDPISEDGRKCLRYLSQNITNGMKVSEAFILERLVYGDSLSEISYKAARKGIYLDGRTIESAKAVLSSNFDSNSKNAFACVDDYLSLTDDFKKLLNEPAFVEYLNQLFEYAFYSYNEYYKPGLKGREIFSEKMPFVYYLKYSRKAVCRLANFKKNHASTMYGYKAYKDIKFLPIFVTYSKDLKEGSTIAYDDRFLNQNVFQWISRNGRTLESQEIKDCIDILKNGNALLFVKKLDIPNPVADDDDFYFLGKVSIDERIGPENAKMDGNDQDVVRFRFLLDKPVPNDIYEYLTSPKL